MVIRPRILVVELEEGERNRLGEILSPEYDVAYAWCGTDAISRLGDGAFDLVLLGSIGEGPDNHALFRGLLSTPDRPKVILLATAFSDELLDRAALLRADGVLESCGGEEVAASVAAHLGS